MQIVYNIYLALVSATLLGVGSEAVSPPMVNLMCPSQLALWPFWLCLFLQGVIQHLGYLLALVYQPLSNVESIKGSDLEGSVDLFSERYARDSLSEFLGGFVDFRSTGGFLLGSSFPYVPYYFRNILNSWKYRLVIEAMFHEVLYLPSDFHLVMKKVSLSGFLTLTIGLLRWPYFLVL